MKTYSEKLSHPKWQKKRLEILNRDNFKCTLCGNDEMQLHIHHLKYVYKNEPWEYPNENLVTLCKICHDICEFIKDGYTHPDSIHYIKNHHENGRVTYSVLTNVKIGELVIKVIVIFKWIEGDLLYVTTIKVSTFKSIYETFNL